MAGHFLAQRVGVERFARFEEDGGGDFLAQPVVGNAEDAAFGNGRMAIDRGLHLGAIDILAAAQHHVFLAVDDVDETVFVDAGDVAGVQPSVGDRFGGGIGAVDIALDHRGAAHP